MINNLLKIVATLLGWLLSDKAIAKRDDTAKESCIEDIKDKLIDREWRLQPQPEWFPPGQTYILTVSPLFS